MLQNILKNDIIKSKLVNSKVNLYNHQTKTYINPLK